MSAVPAAGFSQMLKDLAAGHKGPHMQNQHTAAWMVTLRQVMSHLCHYTLGEPPSGAYLMKTGGCTNPTMLAVALEDQHARAEVCFEL